MCSQRLPQSLLAKMHGRGCLGVPRPPLSSTPLEEFAQGASNPGNDRAAEQNRMYAVWLRVRIHAHSVQRTMKLWSDWASVRIEYAMANLYHENVRVRRDSFGASVA